MSDRPFRINIEQPCSQNPDAMPNVQDGLYCDRCRNVVMDFTRLSDEELIRLFTQKGDRQLCGQFHKSQLEKTYMLSSHAPARSYSGLRLILAGLLSLRLTSEAQSTSAPGLQVYQAGQKKKTNTHQRAIKGKVISRDKHEGIYASIQLYTSRTSDTVHSTFYTDSAGHYELLLPNRGLDRFFKLVYTSEKFQERTIVVDGDQAPAYLPVSLAAEIVVEVVAEHYKAEPIVCREVIRKERIMGIPSEIHYIRNRNTFWYKLTRLFRKKHR